MTVKDHYDKHLSSFYSWYAGDFKTNKDAFKAFCIENKIIPSSSKAAIDLGAGNGIQSIALAELGYSVTAIDFSKQLLDELEVLAKGFPINLINDDIRIINQYLELKPELIVCCGDTLPHLESIDEIIKLLTDSYSVLIQGGKLILTFRDYSSELVDTQRFIPVKSDNTRVFTCFLEYFPDKIRVTDLLHEFEDNRWVQKVSSYYKTRVTKATLTDILIKCGYKIVLDKNENRIIHIIAQKN